MRSWTFVLLFTVLASTSVASAGDPLVRSGDTVAIVGGTLVESLGNRGDCEVAVVLSQPELRVPFRNLGWSGDDVHGSARRVFGTPADGYSRLMSDVKTAAPTVAVLGYGFAEASNGRRGVAEFEQGLRRLAADLDTEGIRRVYLMPFPLPAVRTPRYEQAIDQCREIILRVASEDGSAVVDPSDAIRSAGSMAFDSTGLRLSALGKSVYGQTLAAGLLGTDRDALLADLDAKRVEQFRQLVAAKNALYFHRYRPMNETYLFLFRKHEQGNNAGEVERFEPLVEQAEQAIWDQAGKQ